MPEFVAPRPPTRKPHRHGTTVSQGTSASPAQGRPLNRAVRASMEARFGYDLSRVRVHADQESSSNAAVYGARAYTVGSDIVFGSGQYQPSTAVGRRLLAHELAHVVQQSGAPPAARVEGFSTPGDAAERAADTAARVFGSKVAPDPSSALDLRDALRATRTDRLTTQRWEGAALHYQRRQSQKQYADFIAKAWNYGLPVKFLISVSLFTSIDTRSSEDEYRPFWNSLRLRPATMAAAKGSLPDSDQVGTLYHESTHAYIDLHKDDPPFRLLMDRGERHYTGAPTSSGRTTSDPERVAQEAAGEYVGHRAAAWWRAFRQLNVIQGDHNQVEHIGGIRSRYDGDMAAAVFGYSEEGNWFIKEQDQTTRRIAPKMKLFLDRELLEDKIPDRFDDVSLFRAMSATH